MSKLDKAFVVVVVVVVVVGHCSYCSIVLIGIVVIALVLLVSPNFLILIFSFNFSFYIITAINHHVLHPVHQEEEEKKISVVYQQNQWMHLVLLLSLLFN